MYNLHILKMSRPCTEQLYLTLTFFGEGEHYQLSLKLYCEAVHTDPPSPSIFHFWYIKLYFRFSLCFSYVCNPEVRGLVSGARALSLLLLVLSKPAMG